LFLARRDLGEDADALALDGPDLVLDPAAVEIDLVAFERGAAGPASELGSVAALYAGEFLAGFGLSEPAFEDWLRGERERLRALALDVLERWLAASTAAGRTDDALEAGRRALVIDPVRERVHRALMRLHAARGERAAVARQYRACVEALDAELGTKPDAETTALHREIMSSVAPAASGASRPSPPRPASPTFAPPRAPAPGSRRAAAPLVGRDAEIERLATVANRVTAGAGAVLAVVGEAGIGKTRLVEELVSRMRSGGARVLSGQCYASDAAFALSPWIDALRAVVGDEPLLAAVGAPWRSELGVLVPDLGTDVVPAANAAPHRLFEAVGRLVDGLAATAPLLLVLEDVHWADDATMRLLTFVTRRIARLPVLIVITARDEEPEYRVRMEAIRMELGRARLLEWQPVGSLSEPDAHALVRSLRGTRTDLDDTSLLETVWRTSEGNPLAVIEAVRAAADGSTATRDAGSGPSNLVRALIRERLDRLSAPARRVLETAAVIGRTFEPRLLERATRPAEGAALEKVEDLVRRRLLGDRPDGLAFCHERIREVTYDGITASRRRAMHRAVAEAITAIYEGRADDHAHTLAVHWREAQAWEHAARCFARAGELAARRVATREALACYDEAMAALERMPESAERMALGVDLRVGHGLVLLPLEDRERLLRCIAEAETLCERLEDPRRLANVLALHTCHAINWCDPPEVLAAAERAHAVAERHGDREQRGAAAYLLAVAANLTGDASRSVAICRVLIESGLDQTGPGALFAPPREIMVRAALARSLGELGELAEAERVAQEAVHLGTARRNPYALIVALMSQATLYMRQGDTDRALPAYARAVELGLETGFTQYHLTARGGAAVCRARQGAVAEAITELEQVGAEMQDTGTGLGRPLPAMWLAEAYLRAGRAREARAQVEVALTLTRAHGERLLEGWALCLQGAIAEQPATFAPEAGLTAYRAAIAIADAGGLRPLAAHAHRGAARLYVVTGQLEAARTALACAEEIAQTMRAPLDVPRD
jgi:tetratricopeptide (TPR) repeat protein